jgi:hypothetical protein
VVDNTNTTVAELAPYVAWANAVGYEVEIIRIHCNPLVAAERNTHGVPENAVLAMYVKIQHAEYPPFWPKVIVVRTDEPTSV